MIFIQESGHLMMEHILFDTFFISSRTSDLYSNAVDLQNAGKFQEALDECHKVIALEPDHYNALNSMGCMLDGIGDHKQALFYLNKAIEIEPNNSLGLFDTYLNRGACYKNLGQYDNALKDYLKAVDIKPNDKYALNKLGCLYNDLGNYEQALYYFNIAITHHPVYYLSYYNRGVVYAKQKKYNLAIEDNSRAIELNSLYIRAYRNRGWCYREIGQYDDALKDYSKAIKLDSNNPVGFEARARVAALKGDYKRSTADIRNAVRLKFPEYEPKEMAAVVRHDQQNKAKEAGGRFLSYGFYLDFMGNFRKTVIIYPHICDRIVLNFPKLHISKTIKRHLRQYAGRYELKFDSDFDVVFSQCRKHYKDDYYDVLYMENLQFLFSTMNQNNDSPKAVGVGLYLDGSLVAGEIGVQTGRVYTSYTGYHDVSDAGNAQIVMLARYLEENGFAFWDFGPPTERWDLYKLRLGAEKISNGEYQKLFHSVNPGSENIFTKI
jgi:tetratricopeptide (TPR) repeat protein/Leu/Phe-tRNA-protein transferase